MANGEYANNIDDLDLEFPGTRVNYYGNGFQTKQFDCRPYGDNTSGVWMDALATCNRLPRGTKYAIFYSTDGRLGCRYYSAAGEEVCKTMGTKTGTTYYFN